jgi:hypothetical protein
MKNNNNKKLLKPQKKKNIDEKTKSKPNSDNKNIKNLIFINNFIYIFFI